MARTRRQRRLSTDSRSSSSSTSPERTLDDDNDSFTQHPNDSQSSLGGSISRDTSPGTGRDLGCHPSPIYKLPAEIMISVFSRLSSAADLKACMLVSKDWARNSVGLLWHRPHTDNWESLLAVAKTVRRVDTYFHYSDLIKRLNLSTLNCQISDGTIMPLRECKRVERLTLTNCSKLTDSSLVRLIESNRSLLALDATGLELITDRTLECVAQNCVRLQGLNITSCRKVTDTSLAKVARNCRHLKRLKFNGCQQLTDRSIMAYADHCPYILEIDLHDCKQVENDSVTALLDGCRHLRELRLAHCARINDGAFLSLPSETTFESLRILDLTDCGELMDAGVQKIISAAPRLRNLVLAKCRLLTDRAVMAITRLGKNLHYIHLGHCARITDAGVTQLVKLCNRIRYIDLACCANLTDQSVQQLASLPKLKRIGLVKCSNITDRSILALAKQKQHGQNGPITLSSLERVHLSYCTHLTLEGIRALLTNCPRLTHLSLTGVTAFLRHDLVAFCREAPPEFNDHQREVFCVFSGTGVSRLRQHLNQYDGMVPPDSEAGTPNIETPANEVVDPALLAHRNANNVGHGIIPHVGAIPLPPPPPPPLHNTWAFHPQHGQIVFAQNPDAAAFGIGNMGHHQQQQAQHQQHPQRPEQMQLHTPTTQWINSPPADGGLQTAGSMQWTGTTLQDASPEAVASPGMPQAFAPGPHSGSAAHARSATMGSDAMAVTDRMAGVAVQDEEDESERFVGDNEVLEP